MGKRTEHERTWYTKIYVEISMNLGIVQMFRTSCRDSVAEVSISKKNGEKERSWFMQIGFNVLRLYLSWYFFLLLKMEQVKYGWIRTNERGKETYNALLLLDGSMERSQFHTHTHK